MMGCVISLLLFVMCMEMTLRGAKDIAQGEELENQVTLPPMTAFMDMSQHWYHQRKKLKTSYKDFMICSQGVG